MERLIQLQVGEHVGTVEALLETPANPRLLYVFAHGAGAGMRHSFMVQMTAKLQELNAATLRYNFPYMQAGRGRPDVPAVLEATVRAAIRLGRDILPGLPLIAGGKSMGGRMTSQLLAKEPGLPVQGVAFIGFPLHQPGKPSRTRAAHLFDVVQPMLFIQGTRDTLADISLMREVTTELGSKATLHVIDGADHSFAVLKKSGRTNSDVQAEMARVIVEFGV
jgi:predicted alpha/beta-hydrolase family hydrolase